MENIASLCLQEITFWISTTADAKGHVRATPQPFTIIANQTVRVDMAIDTGIRCLLPARLTAQTPERRLTK